VRAVEQIRAFGYNLNVNQDIALFVFMPFCKIKCTYCDFNAYANLARVIEPYADAVVQEIRAWRLEIGYSITARSVYFGGGTPSLIPIAQIEKILRACETRFTFARDVEITLEANPATADEAKLRAYRALGINRLSIGVQAFDDAALRRLNRGHTVADAIEMYDLARRAGFSNINLDFIYGLPLQTLDAWRATLTRAIALTPEHLSLYALKVEEHTGLEHQIARRKYPKPDDDLAAEMYELAQEMLAANGYAQYEISNWTRSVDVGNWKLDVGHRSNIQLPTSNFQSRHNLTYWHNELYLGFGAGAHSYFERARFWNVSSPVEYIERIARGASALGEREEISRAVEIAETLFLGLRLNEGIAFDEFARRFGEDARVRYAKEMKELKETGLIEMSDTRVWLTPRGRLLSNQVFWRFLP
jgi:oxygen-independent coproporphyrinogen-3 oxidase